MKQLVKKLQVGMQFVLISSFSLLSADYTNCYSQNDCQTCMVCEPQSCSTGYISADLLYWRAYQEGLEDCVNSLDSNKLSSDGRTISRFYGKVRDLQFRWDPGFRIGAGFAFAPHWELATSWTHFHSHAHRSHLEHRVRWNIRLDNLDVTTAYQYSLGSCVDLKPFFGLRSIRIDQKLHFRSLVNATNPLIPTHLNSIRQRNIQRFWGAGPLVGLGANWNLGCGFSFYTSASMALLYGTSHLHFHKVDETVDTVDYTHIKKRLRANLAVADAALGIQWQTCFYWNTQLVIQLGLEHHRYFDYNRLSEGNLSFDGMTLSAGIQF